jgi:AbrB family looped-hinge helix DNA binding protein
MKSAIDAAGRLVIPKPLRDALQLKEGVEVEVRVKGGCLEVEPTTLPMSPVKKSRLMVLRSREAVPPLTTGLVDATIAQLRGDME